MNSTNSTSDKSSGKSDLIKEDNNDNVTWTDDIDDPIDLDDLIDSAGWNQATNFDESIQYPDKATLNIENKHPTDSSTSFNPITPDELLSSLQKHWGYGDLRDNQLEVCQALLSGRDCFYMNATGSGKSLVFMLPTMALADRGETVCTVVISPLISLMQDQVTDLLKKNIPACMLSENSKPELLELALRGRFNFVYCTPEKAMILKQHSLLSKLKDHVKIVCCAVDECHCISEWGVGFRPEYSTLGELRECFGVNVPMVALTASATKRSQQGVIESLHMQNPLIIRKSINRPNLKYVVKQKQMLSPGDVIEELYRCYRKIPHSSSSSERRFAPTLVYAMTKKHTIKIAEKIQQSEKLQGITVAHYSSAVKPGGRAAILQEFLENKIDVVVATTAFGMGINKPDIRLVVHYGMPISVESYYQQTGRGGRDSLPTTCVLLWSREDEKICRTLTVNTSSVKTDFIKPMRGLVGGDLGCRRKCLMSYFNESTFTLPTEPVEHCCDLCDIKRRDIADQQKGMKPLISSIDLSSEVFIALRTLSLTGNCINFKGIISLLHGKDDIHARKVLSTEDVKSFELFGFGKHRSDKWWTALFYQLMDVDMFIGYELRNSQSKEHCAQYFLYYITEGGKQYLSRCEETVMLAYATKTYPRYNSEIRCGLLRKLLEEELKVLRAQERQSQRRAALAEAERLANEEVEEDINIIPTRPRQTKTKRKLFDDDDIENVEDGMEQENIDDNHITKKRETSVSNELSPNCEKDNETKKLQLTTLELLKAQRHKIGKQYRYNIQYVLTSKELKRLVKDFVTIEFVNSNQNSSQLATQLMTMFGWQPCKAKIATLLAEALIDCYFSKSKEDEGNQIVCDDDMVENVDA